ncbi:MAG: LytR C-terminal domain-containing protein [Solirubrobacteraceae bacterium]
MATIPYALSITHFINSVGAKAGFASIIGLALLVLLFFTQSRETANLRRRADEAEQQLYQLQLYVDHLSRARSQPAAAPAPASAQTTGAPVAAPPAAALAARAAASRTIPGEQAEGGGVATIPAAPAGVAAPALSSATRLIPLTEPDEISIRALRPSPNGGSNGEGTANGTVVTPPPAPPPSTAAGGGNGVARPPVPVPMPTMSAASAEPAPPPRVALPRQPRQPTAPPPPRRSGRGPSGRRINPVFFVLAGILAAAVVAVVLIFVTGSSNTGASSRSSSSSSSAASVSSTNAASASKTGKRRRTGATTVTPAAVTVAVLNGTSTNHLAADVLAKLTAAGYHGGTTQNASEAALTSTIVGYTAPSYRPDALAVAKSLNLGSASVQAVSQGDRSKVCGTTASCPAQVVVTAGADLAPNG